MKRTRNQPIDNEETLTPTIESNEHDAIPFVEKSVEVFEHNDVEALSTIEEPIQASEHNGLNTVASIEEPMKANENTEDDSVSSDQESVSLSNIKSEARDSLTTDIEDVAPIGKLIMPSSLFTANIEL